MKLGEKDVRWEKMEHTGMIFWADLLENLHSTNRLIFELDSTELESLRYYSENYLVYGKVGVYAKSVLNTFEPGMHLVDFTLPDPTRRPKSGNRTLKTLEKKTLSISAFPNPSNDKVVLELTNRMDYGNVALYNSNGIKVLEKSFSNSIFVEMNVEKLDAGIYFIVLTDKENNKVAETKLSVIH